MNKYLAPLVMLFLISVAIADTKPRFDRADNNHDGMLNKDEVAGIISDHEFNKADLNHDGRLSKNEYKKIVQLEKRRLEEQG